MNVSRLPSRLALVGGTAVSSVLLLSSAAYAHVTVQPQGEAAKGGYATVNFKVPNERDGASTVKLEVTLPTDHPLASVMPQPVPGWTVVVEKAKLAKPLDVPAVRLPPTYGARPDRVQRGDHPEQPEQRAQERVAEGLGAAHP
ncbi:DUF1775 domain-containing protein, partial [Streptomyces fradiae]|uniref:DUF1775 domain-containing protein n=1 Tax=Streptomyces fradiae TaxID=1906 RepID=UPI0034298EEF